MAAASTTEEAGASEPAGGEPASQRRPRVRDMGARAVARTRPDATFHNTLELAPPFCMSA